MISLSTRTKEAIKTGLAMTIAYGIALSMDWEKPYWAGFAVAIISLATAGQSLNKGALRMAGTLVTTAVLRAQETGLGILVYSLISIFIWPITTRVDFEAAAGKLLSTQKQLYRSYLDQMSGQRETGETQALRVQEAQEQIRFGQLLDAAQTDTYETWEVRQQWRRYQRHATELSETMARWRVSFVEVKALDLPRLLPNLAAFETELDERFTQIARMLANQAPEQYPAAKELALDMAEVRTLSHFHKAALAVTRSRLQNLERLTRSLFDSLRDIKAFGPIADRCIQMAEDFEFEGIIKIADELEAG